VSYSENKLPYIGDLIRTLRASSRRIDILVFKCTSNAGRYN
jgi:hypothetical protein